MTGRWTKSLMAVVTGAFVACSGLVPAGTPVVQAGSTAQYDFVHDPTIIREGETYYVFSTGDPNGIVGNGNIQIRSSTDLVHWQYRGTVFSKIPDWITKTVGSLQNLWAPDISYFDGLYHLYYAGSSFGTNNSVIALATTKTLNPTSPNYHWVDKGLVIQSTSADDWNAIDPNAVVDSSGRAWLAFGSFWSGIKLVRLNKSLGKPISTTPHVYSIATRTQPPDAIEASSITYRDHYYYLFVSFDLCCRGVNSTYHVVVGRSKNIGGPYVDKSGRSLLEGGGSPFLANIDGNMVGQGGESVYRDGNQYLVAYHYYDYADNGNARLQIRRVTWTKSGWPIAGKPLDKSPYW